MIKASTIQHIIKLQHDAVLGNYGPEYLRQRIEILEVPRDWIEPIANELNHHVQELRRILILEGRQPS